jgi:Zn-dependent protease with chaperone function
VPLWTGAAAASAEAAPVDLSVLLTLPVESVAIRAVLAALLSVVAVRLLLRAGLRTPGIRVATALVPAMSLVVVLVLTATSLRLPTLMLPAQTPDALPIPTQGGYLHFAPVALPLLVGTWAVIAATRLWRRIAASVRVHRAAREALQVGTRDPQLERVTRRLATALSVPVPRVVVALSCPGGAFVVGSRRPVIVLGRDLLDQLDAEEVEGLLAHELAHVKRRDNVVAFALGALRDLAFFVPGGGWAVRQLHRERELTADQIAVGVTDRPGALASGLLKVLTSTRAPAQACAAFAPSSGLVDRVRVLAEDPTPVSRTRRGSESAAVAAVVVTATAAALVVPNLVAGADGQRDAVALLWTTATPTGPELPAASEARAFDVYRRTSDLEIGQPSVVVFAAQDEHAMENRRSTLAACTSDSGICPAPESRFGLGLRPRPTITLDEALADRWRATRVAGDAVDGLGLYWLARVQ